MKDQQIVDLFESTNMTLKSLSHRTGKSVNELKKLIMSAPKAKIWKGNKS